MDLTALFPSTDNIYKFLFMGGIFMVVFALVYPLEKENNISIEINNHNKQVELLNVEIKEVSKQVNDLIKLTNKTSDELEKLKKSNNKSLIENVKSEYNKSFAKVKQKEQEVSTKEIVMRYDKSKIEILQKQLDSFSLYKNILLIVGSIFAIVGLIFWIKLTCKTEKLMSKEINK